MRSMLSLVRTGVNRFAAPRFLAVSVCLVTVVLLAATSARAQSTGIPRTVWDTPDLSGYWEYRTTTPLQRPVRRSPPTCPDGLRRSGASETCSSMLIGGNPVLSRMVEPHSLPTRPTAACPR